MTSNALRGLGFGEGLSRRFHMEAQRPQSSERDGASGGLGDDAKQIPGCGGDDGWFGIGPDGGCVWT